jgi:hypothetical protein
MLQPSVEFFGSDRFTYTTSDSTCHAGLVPEDYRGADSLTYNADELTPTHIVEADRKKGNGSGPSVP